MFPTRCERPLELPRSPCVDDDHSSLKKILCALTKVDSWFPLTLEQSFFNLNRDAPALHKVAGLELARFDELLGCKMWVRPRCGPRMWDRCFKNWGLPNFIGVAANMVKFGTVKGGQNGGSTVNWANFFEGGEILSPHPKEMYHAEKPLWPSPVTNALLRDDIDDDVSFVSTRPLRSQVMVLYRFFKAVWRVLFRSSSSSPLTLPISLCLLTQHLRTALS